MHPLWVTCLWLSVFAGVSGCVDLTRPDVAGQGGRSAVPDGGNMGGMNAGEIPRVLWDFEPGGPGAPAWVMFNDGSPGKQESSVESVPLAPGSPDNRALKISASGFTSWGSGVRAAILPNRGFFDASRYSGVSMDIRSTGIRQIQVKIFDGQTAAEQTGGRCGVCEAQWVVLQSVGTEWREIAMPFAGFELWGTNDIKLVGIETSSLIYFEIIISEGDAGEVWIDNLTLYQ